MHYKYQYFHRTNWKCQVKYKKTIKKIWYQAKTVRKCRLIHSTSECLIKHKWLWIVGISPKGVFIFSYAALTHIGSKELTEMEMRQFNIGLYGTLLSSNHDSAPHIHPTQHPSKPTDDINNIGRHTVKKGGREGLYISWSSTVADYHGSTFW